MSYSTDEKLAVLNTNKGISITTFANLQELIYWAILENGPTHFYEMYKEVPKMLEEGKKAWDESQSR